MGSLRWTIVVVTAILGCYVPGPFACSVSSHRSAPASPGGNAAIHARAVASDLGPNDHWSRCPICRAAYERAEANQGR